MKAIQTTVEKTHEILFRPYSTDVLGYSVTLDDCGHFFVINSCYKDIANEICSDLKELADVNFQKFILLQKDGKVQKTDNLNFLEESGA